MRMVALPIAALLFLSQWGSGKVAATASPGRITASGAEINSEESYAENESSDMSESEGEEVAGEDDTDGEGFPSQGQNTPNFSYRGIGLKI